VAYWRKANHIHQWFVTNVQGGRDECQRSYVPVDKLRELKALVRTVLDDHSLAPTLLPTQSGFFFGGTEYDDWYFESLEDTARQLGDVLEEFEQNDDVEFEYQSSW
jgi:hypothetical protein